MIPFIFVPIASQQIAFDSRIQAPIPQIETYSGPAIVGEVPFYSQFNDIKSPKWQKVGCGIASLAMVINFYEPGAVSVNTLLEQGIAANAYDKKSGWIYKGLIELSRNYGLNGAYYDLSKLDPEAAIGTLINYLKNGPVIISTHYKFDPKSPIPHLVVINSINDNTVYYNDPASTKGNEQIPISDFLKAWKKRIIVIKPIEIADRGLLTLDL